MNDKIRYAHSYISGTTVAEIIMDFQREFRDVYPYELMVSELMAVGPLQSLLGNAISKGLLSKAPTKDKAE